MRAGEVLEPFVRTVPRTLASVAVLAGAAVALGVRLFGLTVGGALAVYFVVWWIVLFAILPLGLSVGEGGQSVPGAEPGAPDAPRLNEKALWTTLAGDAVFLLVAGLLPLAGL